MRIIMEVPERGRPETTMMPSGAIAWPGQPGYERERRSCMKRRIRARADLVWREKKKSAPETPAKTSARNWKMSPPVEGST
jgi:hypothetical protein